jgi:hypothetical protein
MAIVQPENDSDFLAWICPATVKIFSLEMASVGPLTHYLGANPNVRSKRVT